MPCQRCNSKRVLSVYAHASDRHVWKMDGMEREDGYLPYDIGIGGGDDIEFDLCLDCGQVQGQFPLPETEYEQTYGPTE
jgi:hypothetical protein